MTKMGSINLNNLKNVGKVASGYTYVDLHLDIEEATVPTTLTNERLQGKDIRVDFDIDAIMNSLNNIFKTVPGERFLIPTFGANLRKYIFSPISESIGITIGNEIMYAIETWEPRVTVVRISVVGYPEKHEYDVTIILSINAFKQQVTFNSIINQDADVLMANLTRVCPT
jgi:phage baseplate assembly protein W